MGASGKLLFDPGGRPCLLALRAGACPNPARGSSEGWRCVMRIEIHEGLASRAVHAGWIARALPDVGDPELRSALLASERFSRRIADSILGDPVSVEHVEPSVDFCRLVRQLDDDLLVRIGQIWLAPQLAPHLIDP